MIVRAGQAEIACLTLKNFTPLKGYYWMGFTVFANFTYEGVHQLLPRKEICILNL